MSAAEGFRWLPSGPRHWRRHDGGVKSSWRRAYAQWIVTTRLLYHLHDPARRIGRMQRILPRDGVKLQDVGAGPGASAGHGLPTRWGARPEGLSVSVYAARGRIAAIRHGF